MMGLGFWLLLYYHKHFHSALTGRENQASAGRRAQQLERGLLAQHGEQEPWGTRGWDRTRRGGQAGQDGACRCGGGGSTESPGTSLLHCLLL